MYNKVLVHVYMQGTRNLEKCPPIRAPQPERCPHSTGCSNVQGLLLVIRLDSREGGVKIPHLLGDLARNLIGPHWVLVRLLSEAKVGTSEDERE